MADSGNISIVVIEDNALLSDYNDEIVLKTLMPSLILTIFTMMIGAPGNALVFFVYIRRLKKSTSAIFITALAACDLLNCFFSMPVEICFIVNFLQTDNPVLCKISRFLTFLMNDGSSAVLVGIAFDRFFKLVVPFKTQMSTKVAKIIVLVAMTISLTISWPSIFIYGTQSMPLPTKTKNTYLRGQVCLIDDAIKDTKWPLMFSSTIMFCNIVVDILLVVLYSVIGCKVLNSANIIIDTDSESNYTGSRTSRGSSTRSSSGSWKDRIFSRPSISRTRSNSISNYHARRSRMIKSTLMLFLVTLLFMVSFVPYCIIVTIRNLKPELLYKASNTNKAMFQLFLRTYFLSSALNPVIYSFLSVRFRNECKKVFSNIASKFRYI